MAESRREKDQWHLRVAAVFHSTLGGGSERGVGAWFAKSRSFVRYWKTKLRDANFRPRMSLASFELLCLVVFRECAFHLLRDTLLLHFINGLLHFVICSTLCTTSAEPNGGAYRVKFDAVTHCALMMFVAYIASQYPTCELSDYVSACAAVGCAVDNYYITRIFKSLHLTRKKLLFKAVRTVHDADLLIPIVVAE